MPIHTHFFRRAILIRNFFTITVSVPQPTSGVISANHWGSNISYSATFLSQGCYCDVSYAKNIRIELAALLLYHRKNTAISYCYRRGVHPPKANDAYSPFRPHSFPSLPYPSAPLPSL